MRVPLSLAVLVGALSPLAAQPKPPAVLEKSCVACHGNGKAKSNFGSVLDAKKMIADKLIIPGQPEASPVYVRLGVDQDMPPGDAPAGNYKPTPADIKEVREWILALGAPAAAPPKVEAPPAAARTPVSTADLIRAARADLFDAAEEDRPFLRYFSVANAHNNPNFDDTYLRYLRAALSKMINSLSLKPILVPRVVAGTHDTLLCIDLRKLDWDQCGMWPAILAAYPYGLTYDEDRDEKLATAAKDLKKLCGVDLPIVRADWFIVSAARPPLYHTLLFSTLMGLKGGSVTLDGKLLPGATTAMTDRQLEDYLKVDVEGNFAQDKLQRAAFSQSGVSRQNRMIERHTGGYGAYWKSYDFIKDTGRGNLLQFPLGPTFPANKYNDQAFAHDGGEIIFTLPNHLQGYFLVNDKGQRIDEGPTAVVRDENETSGSVAIVNGLSCMYCHSKGSKSGTHASLMWLREGHTLQGEFRDKVKRLYPDDKTMKAVLAEDQDRFVTAVKKATGPFLKTDDKFIEPVGVVAVKMNKDELTLASAAAELGYFDAKDLKAAIENNQALQDLGLKPLVAGRTVKRRMWEGKAPTNRYNSVFQEAAMILDRGTPKNR